MKLENILEDRAELEASKTIIGRLLTSMVDEGVLAPTATNKCVLKPPEACGLTKPNLIFIRYHIYALKNYYNCSADRPNAKIVIGLYLAIASSSDV